MLVFYRLKNTPPLWSKSKRDGGKPAPLLNEKQEQEINNYDNSNFHAACEVLKVIHGRL
jgi:hypothetical protein